MGTRFVVVGNRKGGACKTSVTFHLACALANHHNLTVGLVDLDGQANLTKWALAQREDEERRHLLTIAPVHGGDTATANPRFPGCPEVPWSALYAPEDVLFGGVPIAEAMVVSPHHQNLVIWPGAKSFSSAVDTYARENQMREEQFFALFAEKVGEPLRAYRHPLSNRPLDVVLIDMPPTDSLLPMAAMAFAQGILGVGTFDGETRDGLFDLEENVRTRVQAFNPEVVFDGVVLSRAKLTQTLDKEMLEDYAAKFGGYIVPEFVPDSTHIKSAMTEHSSLFAPQRANNRVYLGRLQGYHVYCKIAEILVERWQQMGWSASRGTTKPTRASSMVGPYLSSLLSANPSLATDGYVEDAAPAGSEVSNV